MKRARLAILALAWCAAAPAAADFAPTNVTGCVLWLRADAGIVTNDAGEVTEWQDGSGLGKHANLEDGTYPAFLASDAGIGGLPAVVFTRDRLGFPVVSGRTVFAVCRVESGALNQGLLGYHAGAGTETGIRLSNASRWRFADGNVNDFITPSTGAFLVNGRTGSVFSTNEWHIAEARRSSNSRRFHRIGGYYLTRDIADCAVAEVVLYDRTLTQDESLRVGDYLERKYGLSGGYRDPDRLFVTTQPATEVRLLRATLNGALERGVSPDPAFVRIYWGPADGATNAESWAHCENLGERADGAFSAAVSGLTNGAACFFRCAASQGVASVWAEATLGFTATSSNFWSGTVATDTVWQAAHSPYVVTNNLDVPAGRRLTIEPGVEVRIAAARRIRAYGSLAAVGLEGSPIRFGGHPAGVTGGYLQVSGSAPGALMATGAFAHCRFERMSGPMALLDIDATLFSARDCVFTNITGKVVEATGSRVRVTGCEFRNVGEGVNLVHSAGLVSSNVFRSITGYADSLDNDYEWTYGGDPSVIFECNDMRVGSDSRADGIDIGMSSNVTVRYNTIVGFADKGISLGPLGHARIHDNLVADCGIGLAIKDGSNPWLANNTIAACRGMGIAGYEKGEGPGGGGRGSGVNMIVWGSPTEISLLDGSTLNLEYSLVPGADVWPGSGNLTNAPGFAEDGFQLRSDSPCVNAGTNGPWMERGRDLAGGARVLLGTADMGAYEFVPASPSVGASWWAGELGAGLVFSWAGESNRMYLLESCTNLLPGGWEPWGDPVPYLPLNAVTGLVDEARQRFYRLRVVE